MTVLSKSSLRTKHGESRLPSAFALVRWSAIGVWLLALSYPLAGFSAAAAPSVNRLAAPAWVERFTPDLAKPAAPEDNGGEGVKFLLRDEQIHAGEQVTYRHFAMRFLSQDGVQENSTLGINFDPAYATLRFHQLVIHRGGQRMDRLAKQEIKLLQRETNLESQLYDGQLTATIILDDIRVGDVVEYAYSVRGANPIFAGHYVDTFQAQWRRALPQWRERLLWPQDRPAPDIQNHETMLSPQTRKLKDGKLIEYRWEANDLPGHQADDETPSWTELYGWVQISDFSSWNEVARWAAKLFKQATLEDRQPLPDDLQRAVETIRALPDRSAQAVAALRYVQDNFRYLGIEIGANSHQPYSIATVCQRRFGDCKDKANLLSTLLRRLGFEADPALVETDYRQTVAKWHPTPFAFNHAIVRMRLNDRTYWLDPTREHQGGTLDHLFSADYGKSLVAREDTQELSDVPPRGFEESGVDITDSYRQKRYSSPATLSIHAVTRGVNADRMRGYLARTSAEQMQREYLNFYARQHPKIRSLAAIQWHDDLDKNELTIDESYEVSEFWGENADPAAKYLYASFYPKDLRNRIDLPNIRLRTMPFGIRYPERISETIQVYLPGKTDMPPEQVEVKDKAFNFSYTSRSKPSAGSLTLSYRYEALTNVVETNRVPEYLANAQRALDQLEYKINLGRNVYASSQPAAAENPSARPKAATAMKTPASPATRESSGAPLSPSFWGLAGMLAGLGLGVAIMRLRAAFPVKKREPLPVAPPPLPLHCCVVCGRTNLTNPELDFRVARDGMDYCEQHKSAASAQPARQMPPPLPKFFV